MSHGLGKTHYTGKILRIDEIGTSACGQQVKESVTFNDKIAGRDNITCRNCIHALERQDKRKGCGYWVA